MVSVYVTNMIRRFCGELSDAAGYHCLKEECENFEAVV